MTPGKCPMCPNFYRSPKAVQAHLRMMHGVSTSVPLPVLAPPTECRDCHTEVSEASPIDSYGRCHWCAELATLA